MTPIGTDSLQRHRDSATGVTRRRGRSAFKAAALGTRVAAAARAELIAIDCAFHTRMIGTRINVKVQCGPDSPEVQAVGRKKKSDRKRPKRRVMPTNTEG